MEKYFTGGNTSKGFVSFYNNIFDYSRQGKFYIIKGGSGVGKSSLMRKCAKALEAKGYSVEYYLCAGDYESLDGIYCQKLNIAMVDGTMPHMIDPTLPFISGEKMVDLSIFVQSEFSAQEKEQYKNASATKKKLYKEIYQLLDCLDKLFEIKDSTADSNQNKLDNVYKSIKNIICREYSFVDCISSSQSDNQLSNNCDTKIIKRFVTAYSTGGFVSLLDKISKNKTIIEINGISRNELTMFLQRIEYYLRTKVDKITIAYNSLNPKYADCLITDKFVIGNYYGQSKTSDYVYNFLDSDNNIDLCNNQLDNLINDTKVYVFELLAKTKLEHMNIENIVKTKMNWSEYSKMTDNLIQEMLE